MMILPAPLEYVCIISLTLDALAQQAQGKNGVYLSKSCAQELKGGGSKILHIPLNFWVIYSRRELFCRLAEQVLY